MDIEICGSSFFQPLNFNCNPTENNAKGPTVAASLSNKGSAKSRLINCEIINAPIHPKKGGKVNNLFRINFALTFPVLLPPLKAVIIPNVESPKNIVWSQIIAILKYCSPKNAAIKGKPTKEVLLYPLAISIVLLERAEYPFILL